MYAVKDRRKSCCWNDGFSGLVTSARISETLPFPFTAIFNLGNRKRIHQRIRWAASPPRTFFPSAFQIENTAVR